MGSGAHGGPAASGFAFPYKRMVIAGDGVVLRPFRPADVPRFLEAAQDPEIVRWSRLPREWTTEEGAREHIASLPERAATGDRLDLAVSLPESEALVGHVALRNLVWEARRARVGVWVCREVRGRGVATRALDAIVRWGFREAGLNRIDCDPEVDNEASIRMVERVGFRREGRMRAHAFADGAYRDAFLYSRLAGDPAP